MTARPPSEVRFDRFAFFQIARERGLTGPELSVLMTVCLLTEWRNLRLRTTYIELAEATRHSRDTISKAIRGLAEAEVLRVTKPFGPHQEGEVEVLVWDRVLGASSRETAANSANDDSDKRSGARRLDDSRNAVKPAKEDPRIAKLSAANRQQTASFSANAQEEERTPKAIRNKEGNRSPRETVAEGEADDVIAHERGDARASDMTTEEVLHDGSPVTSYRYKGIENPRADNPSEVEFGPEGDVADASEDILDRAPRTEIVGYDDAFLDRLFAEDLGAGDEPNVGDEPVGMSADEALSALLRAFPGAELLDATVASDPQHVAP